MERVIVVNPDDTGIVQARAKTDRLDARALARLLWKGELESVWIKDERCRVLRRRLARREQVVHARTRSKNEIHATLQPRVQDKPPSTDLFGTKARRWLEGLALVLEERESVDAAIRLPAAAEAQVRDCRSSVSSEEQCSRRNSARSCYLPQAWQSMPAPGRSELQTR